MSGKLLVRSYIAISTLILFIAIILTPGKYPLHARMQDQTKEQPKTVELVKKNIQVLKGMPASQLSMVMDYFAASLGVHCDHCHVIDATGWYMDKDDKPTKQTARKMIKMVMDLNVKEFGGRSAVTCYTCHHGSTEPAKIIPLPQPPVKA